ncbi:MAG: FtsX-like permease family protein [Bacteroidetes bacterium]|nr:FtsX-like permease family protein [Bacteroidota bacterium]
MLLRLAWRNIWRNRRRSLIILTSVVVGLIAIVFIEAVVRGFMRQSLDNQLGTHTAHIQVHRMGYHDNPAIDRFIARPEVVDAALAADARIAASSRRVLATGLLSSARNSSGIMLVGIEPEREARVTIIQRSIVAGRNLGLEPREILISERMSRTLDVGLGDKVVAMSSTREGKVGSELFRVVGLFRTSIMEFDRVHAYIPHATAQSLIGAGAEAAEFAMVLHATTDLNAVRDSLRVVLGPEYEVQSYEDLIPTMAAMVELTERSMIIYYVILGLAMIFGIINTMMMSVYERIRELGVLKAVGMQDRMLFWMVLLEAAMLGTVGTSVGLVLGNALNAWIAVSGLNFSWFSEGLSSWGTGAIIYPVLDPLGSVRGGLLIVAMCVLAALQPALKAVRLHPMDAIRHL